MCRWRRSARCRSEAARAPPEVSKIVMVSTGTCARDLRLLVDGGYRITRGPKLSEKIVDDRHKAGHDEVLLA